MPDLNMLISEPGTGREFDWLHASIQPQPPCRTLRGAAASAHVVEKGRSHQQPHTVRPVSGESCIPGAGEGTWILESHNPILASHPITSPWVWDFGLIYSSSLKLSFFTYETGIIPNL